MVVNRAGEDSVVSHSGLATLHAIGGWDIPTHGKHRLAILRYPSEGVRVLWHLGELYAACALAPLYGNKPSSWATS